MYAEFFKLQALPFHQTFQVGRFYPGGRRGTLLSAMRHTLIAHKTIILKLTGENGSGKSILCQQLASQLPDGLTPIYMPYSDEALPLADRLSQAIAKARPSLPSNGNDGSYCVFVDDVHNYSDADLLHSIKLSHGGQARALKFVLIGQPKFDDRLQTESLAELKAAVKFNFILAPLTVAEIVEYITWSLHRVGWQGALPFSRQALKCLTLNSGGLIRVINQLADGAMANACQAQRRQIGYKDVVIAVKGRRLPIKKLAKSKVASSPILYAGLLTGLVGLVLLMVHFFKTPMFTMLPLPGRDVGIDAVRPSERPTASALPSAPLELSPSDTALPPAGAAVVTAVPLSTIQTTSAEFFAELLPPGQTLTSEHDLENLYAATNAWLGEHIKNQSSAYVHSYLYTDGKHSESIIKFINQLRAEHPNEALRAYHRIIEQKRKVVVFIGVFASYRQALIAYEALPAVIKEKYQPSVQNIIELLPGNNATG